MGHARAGQWNSTDVLTFRDGNDGPDYELLLRRLDEGRVKRVAFVQPAGPSWPLPLYELALMTAARCSARGLSGVELNLFTPEEMPLGIFGKTASVAVGRLLRDSGVAVHTSRYVVPSAPGWLDITPGERQVATDRVVTVPSLVGPRLRGMPCDPEGFLQTDAHGRIVGVDGVFAAGDATTFPIKQGALATQQADAVAEAIAASAGVELDPQPFRPILREVLLTGGTARYLRADISGAAGDDSTISQDALWWPADKLASRYLAPFLSSQFRDATPMSCPSTSTWSSARATLERPPPRRVPWPDAGELDDRSCSAPPSRTGPTADIDAVETSEWVEALDAVVAHDGPDRARELLTRVIERAQHSGTGPIASLNTPYVNTIPREREARLPGDPAVERRLRSIVRWNAMAMVVRANKESSELGGHIASYQSLATLYEVGFNHFWRAPSEDHAGDLVYFQGHSSPGNYARAFLEGRLTAEQLDGFRREVSRDGLASYPHPWLMPDFWQFPTVSLGIGPITSIYQARFMKYLQARSMADTAGRKVWTFCGDGEMDEPESMGAIGLAGREQLDNLIWVVNCNLQRLDGPVRGNGKIIQDLEAEFRGAGWNVIKVVWGSRWDPLLAADTDGALVRVMEECVDGEYQTFKARDGAYVREHFFGRDPRLLKRVEHMSDEEIWLLNRGGLDQQKVYAAYHEAVRHTGQPTVILAKTIKGYGMGASGEGQMITHQAKKMTEDALLTFRDRFELPLSDEQVRAAEYYKPPDDSAEMRYLRERRAALGGSLPVRRRNADPLPVPDLDNL